VTREEICDLRGYVIHTTRQDLYQIPFQYQYCPQQLRKLCARQQEYQIPFQQSLPQSFQQSPPQSEQVYHSSYQNTVNNPIQNNIPKMRQRSFKYPELSSGTINNLINNSSDSVDDFDIISMTKLRSQSSQSSQNSQSNQSTPNKTKFDKKQDDGVNLSTEMAKLACNLNKQILDNDIEKNIEHVYPDLKEDIRLDKEIAIIENEFISDTESDESDDNYYDNIMKIDTRKQNKKCKDDKLKFDNNQYDNLDDIPKEMRDQFTQLIAARNNIRDTIEADEELVNKANKNLNEEQFEERCKIQEEKKLKKTLESQKSILSANKISFLKMRSKIVKGTLKESNIPFMFNDKYCVLRYMEINELIDLGSNDDINTELTLYNSLYKTIEAREYEVKSYDSEDDSDYSPLDDVEEDLIEICADFMEYLEENFPDTVSESKIHDELNKEINEKNKIFHNDYNKNDFVKDSSKNNDSDDSDGD
jgi:hypothetical protein